MLAYPSEGFAVVALCNDAAAWPARMARRVAESCLADRMAPAPALGPNPPTRTLKALAGLYRTANDVLVLDERDGSLFLRGLPIALRPLGAHTFALDGDPDSLRLDFRRRPAEFDLTQGLARADRFVRCVPPKAIDEDALLGDFESAETGASGQVSRAEAGLTVSFARQRPAALRAIAPDCMWAADLGATLTFARDGSLARGFTLSGGRVRGIAFSRRP